MMNDLVNGYKLRFHDNYAKLCFNMLIKLYSKNIKLCFKLDVIRALRKRKITHAITSVVSIRGYFL